MSEPAAGPFDRRPWQQPVQTRAPLELPLPPRFSLLTLFGVVTAAAVYCWLLRQLGVYAVVLLLAALVSIILLKVSAERRRAKRLVIDLLAGIVLPIGCLYFDPIVFRKDGWLLHTTTLAAQVAAYAFFAVEMITLFIWVSFGGVLHSFFREVVAGVLATGWFVAMGFGVILAFPCLLGMLAMQPMAVLGLVPWFTFRTYWANSRCAGQPREDRPPHPFAFLAGISFALIVSIAAYETIRTVSPHAEPISFTEVPDNVLKLMGWGGG